MTGPDLRLAPVALACWLGAYACLGWTATVSFAVAGAAVALAYLARGRAAVATGLIGLALAGAATGIRLTARDDPALRDLADRHATVRVELTVSDDPHAVAGRRPTWAIAAHLTHLTGGDGSGAAGRDRRENADVLVLASDPAWRNLLPGQHVTADGRLAPPRDRGLLAAIVSVNEPPAAATAPPWVQRAAGGLRAGLRDACAGLDPRPGGLLPGLVVGDTSRLPPEVADDFRAVGMTHLTAVSGSNLAVILGCLLYAARWARAGPRLSAGLCVLGVVGFVILARPSPSVLRAAVMGAIALVALATGRGRAALPALCATVTVLVVADPGLAGDPGFALSVCATAGLLLLAPPWRDALRRRGFPRWAAEALAVPAAAQVACGPVIAAISGTVSIVAIPANLLVAAAITPATLLGVAATALSAVWPAGAAAVAWLASWPVWWLVEVARVGAGLPLGNLPWPAGTPGALLLAGLTILLLVGFRSTLIRRLVLVAVLSAVLGAAPVRLLASGWPPPGWIYVMCDVGQGDATVLRTGDHQAIVVDAGPGPSLVDGCLDDLGITDVPLLVITHFHADHVGGVAGVFDHRRVRAVVTSAWPEPVEGRRLLAEQAAAVPVTAAEPGQVRRIGPVTLTILGPVTALRGTRSDPNDNSVVALAATGGVRVLLTGDAEVEEQEELAGLVGRVDVLKVAHHGSAFQAPAFLDAVRPRVALVSVGQGNPYGHPSPSVLAYLSRGGARVVRTDLAGDIAIVVTQGAIAITLRDP
ncbi:ComEC/Rec2 family competence protein [Hamadaea tsunoensis]|uniref:ComEC/Rec2 family competence protein n=1 Tax=Hamadaea tsunoensis TaxID=53368 RepID=UPI0004206A4C|nr:ComEC/Rec2 family competence protein [Hamadaea tsunoensis]